MKGFRFATLLCLAGLLASGQALAQGKVIQLPQEDRAVIEQYLGTGVVGAAIAGNPIADGTDFFAFKDGTWTFRYTSGDKKGKTQIREFKKLKRDKEGLTGRYKIGTNEVLYMLREPDGSISVLSQTNNSEGVIMRYSPPEQVYVSGMNPGDRKESTLGVKVYDLSDKNYLKYSGSLHVTYSYVGAYKVTVPAGTYDAALLKWHFVGHIGPASITDLQYRFMVEDLGTVATIERKDISALLIYNNHKKFGGVLVSQN